MHLNQDATQAAEASGASYSCVHSLHASDKENRSPPLECGQHRVTPIREGGEGDLSLQGHGIWEESLSDGRNLSHKSIFLLTLFCVCMHVYECGCWSVHACMWRSEDCSEEGVLSFRLVESGYQTWVIKLDSKINAFTF